MADGALAKFIKNRLEMGYDSGTVKLELIAKGYSSPEIDAAMSEAQKQAKVNFHVPTFWIALTIILAVVIVLIFVLLKLMGPAEIPEAPVVPAETQPAVPGEIPSKPAEQAPVITPPAAAPEKKEEPEYVVATPAGSGAPKYDFPRIGFDVMEKIEQIKAKSHTNSEAAGILCSELIQKIEQDRCYFEIAKSASDPGLCSRISDTLARDSCYFSFAAMLVNTCASINDLAMRKNCEQLISLNLTLP